MRSCMLTQRQVKNSRTGVPPWHSGGIRFGRLVGGGSGSSFYRRGGARANRHVPTGQDILVPMIAQYIKMESYPIEESW